MKACDDQRTGEIVTGHAERVDGRLVAAVRETVDVA